MVIDGDSTKLSCLLISSWFPGQETLEQALAQTFPQWAGRRTLSAHECHCLLLACDLAAATA